MYRVMETIRECIPPCQCRKPIVGTSDTHAFDADDGVPEVWVQAKDAADRQMDDHMIGNFVTPRPPLS